MCNCSQYLPKQSISTEGYKLSSKIPQELEAVSFLVYLSPITPCFFRVCLFVLCYKLRISMHLTWLVLGFVSSVRRGWRICVCISATIQMWPESLRIEIHKSFLLYRWFLVHFYFKFCEIPSTSHFLWLDFDCAFYLLNISEINCVKLNRVFDICLTAWIRY